MPKRFDLQIFVEDTAGRTDLNTLTIQVADKNERPVFWGNMAIQSKIMVASEKSSTQKDGIRYIISQHPMPVVKVVQTFSHRKTKVEQDDVSIKTLFHTNIWHASSPEMLVYFS